jgi:SAM-dependent methyltransferase
MIAALLRSIHKPIYEHRIHVLSEIIVGECLAGETILDVGCGNGRLANTILQSKQAPEGLRAEGVETSPRGGEPIPVHHYDRGKLPFEDDSYDVVLVADVLHHDKDPVGLLRECLRVCRRVCFLKDHKPEGIFGYWRICLLDWGANAGYGVPCLFDYPTVEGWRKRIQSAGGEVEKEWNSMSLYPGIWDAVFGRKLHYATLVRKHPR